MRKLLILLLALLAITAFATAEEPTLWPACDDATGLWGYIDETGAWMIAPQYKQAYRFSGGCAIVGMGEDHYSGPPREGIIDATGAFVLPPEYFVFDDFAEDVFFVMDPTGDDTVMGWFYIPDRFFTGLHWYECVAYSDGPYVEVDDGEVMGLADRATGEIVLPMEYTRTGLYEGTAEDGFIVAERDDTGECELIEIGVGPVELPEGAVIDYGEGVSEGLIPFEMDGQWGYLNTAGEIVIPAQYDCAYGFRDGYAEVGLLDEVGTHAVIDRQGQIILTGISNPWSYGYHGVVAGALFVEWEDGDWGLVEMDGTIRCRHALPEGADGVWLREFSAGGPIWVEYALADDEYAYALLSREGELGEPRWTWVSGGGELLAVSEDGVGGWGYFEGTFGYVDANGNEVLPAVYDWAEPFEGALARVRFSDMEEGYINRAGEIVRRWRVSGEE